jgi:hypothetical protein
LGMFPDLIVEEPTAETVPAKGRALEFLQAIYQSEHIPLSVRMRAAIEALPFETPKLSATAIVPGEGDFAERLKRAVIRSRQWPKLIEHSPADIARDQPDFEGP